VWHFSQVKGTMDDEVSERKFSYVNDLLVLKLPAVMVMAFPNLFFIMNVKNF